MTTREVSEKCAVAVSIFKEACQRDGEWRNSQPYIEATRRQIALICRTHRKPLHTVEMDMWMWFLEAAADDLLYFNEASQ